MKKTIIYSLIYLLLAGPLYGAEIIRYLDTDLATGAEDGTSWEDAYFNMDDFDTGEQTNLVTATNTMILNCRGATDDTSAANIGGGWTQNATYFCTIVGEVAADGKWDDSLYTMHSNDDGTAALSITGDGFFIRGVQFKMTSTGGTAAYGIFNLNECNIRNCLFKGVASGTGINYGMHSTGGSADSDVINCIAYDSISGADASHVGFNAASGAVMYTYNCVAYNCGQGYTATSSYHESHNSVAGTCNVDYAIGVDVIDYCCTDDGDGTNSNGPVSKDWDNEFTDANNGDFTPVVGGNILDSGTDDPSTGLYSDDIIGESRTSTWSRGAYESIATVDGPQMYHSKNYWHNWIQDFIKGNWKIAA